MISVDMIWYDKYDRCMIGYDMTYDWYDMIDMILWYDMIEIWYDWFAMIDMICDMIW